MEVNKFLELLVTHIDRYDQKVDVKKLFNDISAKGFQLIEPECDCDIEPECDCDIDTDEAIEHLKGLGYIVVHEDDLESQTEDTINVK